MGGSPALVDIAFDGRVIEWRGPAPFYFVAIPDAHTGEVQWAARIASYGWGCVPVEAEARGQSFETSLFPRDGGYLVPLKLAVRKATGILPGDQVAMRVRIVEPA
ncbi:DUF1905 domain-containing protein [Sphingomonas sp. MS122]|uniref:DUF1905 domain-containing protein n=1 Tax=Sphingomonas sp. MS122 TaxID=3412683 RepID=UPI003C30C847